MVREGKSISHREVIRFAVAQEKVPLPVILVAFLTAMTAPSERFLSDKLRI
ncbi:MAG: hypothetical protein ACE5LA_04875 [Dehalococcoidales bacterium]